MIRNFVVNFSITKIYIKFMLPCIILLLFCMFFVIYFTNHNSLILNKDTYSDEIFNFCAKEIDESFSYYLDLATYYNDMFNNYNIISSSYRRNFYNSLSASIANKNTNIKALWADFDKNKLDGLDAQYKNTEYYSENGRFNICWYRDNDRQNTLKYQKYSSKQQEIFLTQPYIKLPKETKEPVIIEPTILNTDNLANNVIFTFSLPVFDKDSNVIGVTGLDISIKSIINLLDKSKINLIKSFVLLSNKGVYFSHIEFNLVGKTIKYNKLYQHLQTDSVLKELSKNKTIKLDNIIDNTDGTNIMIYYYPIKIKGISNTNLYVGMALFTDSVSIDTSSFIMELLQFSIILLILVIIVIPFLAICIDNILYNKLIVEIDKLSKDNTTKKNILKN